MRLLVKILITSLIIVGISELAKRYSWLAAILAALPITSILAMIWLYWDTRDVGKISELSYGILWAVLPSLLFFWVLPQLLKLGLRFPVALVSASIAMAIMYAGYVWVLKRMGIEVL